MEIYDTANRLAQEIKQSEEYKAYKTAKENIKAKPELIRHKVVEHVSFLLHHLFLFVKL